MCLSGNRTLAYHMPVRVGVAQRSSQRTQYMDRTPAATLSSYRVSLRYTPSHRSV